MFKQKIDHALDYVAKGLSVRILGAPGSGRTTLVKGIVEKLEEGGTKVYSIFAVSTLTAVPFAGILSLGLDLRSRTIGILGIADLLSVQLARTGAHVIVIDDIENLDRESLAVVDVLHTRTNVPLVVTTNDMPFQSRTPATTLGRMPEATVSLGPLGYEQVSKLIMKTLGAPADVNVAARVLTKSGGNLRLAVRIIKTAVLSETLVLRDGRWCMSGNRLMNEHLHGTIEAMLQGLSPEELSALNKMSLLGPCPVDRLVSTIGEKVLDSLEYLRFVSVVPGPDGTLLAAVFPPIVEDYLRAHVLSSRKILQSALTDNFIAASNEPHRPATPDNLLSGALSSLHLEMNNNHTAATQYFQQRLEAIEQLYYQTWESDRSVSNAVAFLRVYWGAPIDATRIREVLKRTDVTHGSTADLFFFTMTLALWQVVGEGDLPGAIAAMRSLAAEEPGWAAEAEAFTVFLEASYGKMPDNLDQVFARLAKQQPASGVVAATKGILELYRLNPEGALNSIDSAEGFESFPRFEPFIRGMALFASGRIDEALVFALERRKEALRDVDQFILVSQSYVAALALLYRGLFDEAEYLMGRAFSLRRPGFLVDSLHNAMLRLSSLRGRASSTSSGAQAGAQIRDIGPLPGTGKGVHDLVTRQPASANAFDESASRLIDEQLDHGFVLEAVYSGLLALCLLPGPRVRERLQRTLKEHGITIHDQLLAIADAIVIGDLQRMKRLLDVYETDGDIYQIAMLLRGAEQRSRLSGQSGAAMEIKRAAKVFTARFQPKGTFISFEPEPPGSSLTLRETEIALLAGQHSNQDIATHFGISIRTVESHISNALRKTDTTTRKQLADLIRSTQKPVLSARIGHQQISM